MAPPPQDDDDISNYLPAAGSTTIDSPGENWTRFLRVRLLVVVQVNIVTVKHNLIVHRGFYSLIIADLRRSFEVLRYLARRSRKDATMKVHLYYTARCSWSPLIHPSMLSI